MSTQAFPVIPSASSGGGGGGDPAAVQWIDIEDLGAGYSALDPDALITSYSYNSGTKEHALGLPALPNTGSVYYDYSMSTTLGTIQFPRWSKALTDANAASIDTDVRFVMMLRLYDFDKDTVQGWSFGLGFSRDQSDTNRNTCAFNALTLGTNVSGAENAQCVYIAASTSSSMANAVECIGQASCAGSSTNKVLGTSAQVYSTTNGSGVARVGAFTVAAGTPLYLQLFACTTGNVLATTAGTFKFKLQYSVLRMP